jgi:guanylate kinase
MICLVGCSAAGKSTIERELCKHGLNRIISYTSRPMRKGEINHVDYHFVSDDDFLYKADKGFYQEKTIYNGWRYGIAAQDCVDDAIAVVEPTGLAQLKKNPKLNILSFYIKTDERTRLKRMCDRGDVLTEMFRRIFSDQGAFNGIENEVNYIVENEDGKLDQAVDEILNIVQLNTNRNNN